MAKPRVPMELQSKKVSKEERERRIQAENELVGDRSLLSTPPEHLREPEKEIYLELVKPLLHIKALANADREIIAICANAKYRMIQANELIEQYGLLVNKENTKTHQVELVENPAIKTFKTYEGIFNRNMTAIGMSASARSKFAIDIEQETKENKLNNLLSGLRG
ncbi:Phage terminase%2C small subunit [uncultured Clostridium sp.]|nr:Phage terminase%2C small subunit [uncultured Clostridium sp.]